MAYLESTSYPTKLSYGLTNAEMLELSEKECWEYRNTLDWKRVIGKYVIPDCIVDKYGATIDWFSLLTTQKVAVSLIDKYSNVFKTETWYAVSKLDYLTEAFIRKYKAKLELTDLCQYCIIPSDVTTAYLKSLTLHHTDYALSVFSEYQDLTLDLLFSLDYTRITGDTFCSILYYQQNVINEEFLDKYWGRVKDLEITYQVISLSPAFRATHDYNELYFLRNLTVPAALELYNKGLLSQTQMCTLQLKYNKPFSILDLSFVEKFTSSFDKVKLQKFALALGSIEGAVISEDVFIYFISKGYNLDWFNILRNVKLSEAFIYKYFDVMLEYGTSPESSYTGLVSNLIKKQQLSEGWIVEHLRYFSSEYKCYVGLYTLYVYQGLSENFFNTYLSNYLESSGTAEVEKWGLYLTSRPFVVPFKFVKLFNDFGYIDWDSLDMDILYDKYSNELEQLLLLMPLRCRNKLPWRLISKRKDLSEKFIFTYAKKLDFDILFSNYKLSEAMLLKLVKKVGTTLIGKIFATYKVSEGFIEQLFKLYPIQDNYNIYENERTLVGLTYTQTLSVDFIERYYPILNKRGIASSQKLSSDFLQAHLYDLPLHDLLVNPYFSKAEKLKFLILLKSEN